MGFNEERYNRIEKQKDSETNSEYLDRRVEGILSTDREIQRKENQEARDDMKAWANRHIYDDDNR